MGSELTCGVNEPQMGCVGGAASHLQQDQKDHCRTMPSGGLERSERNYGQNA